MNAIDLSKDADKYVVIDDGRYRYPVSIGNIPMPIHNIPFRAIDYLEWRSAMQRHISVTIGSRECAELCEALIDHGSELISLII